MKKTTLAKVMVALETLETRVVVPDDVLKRARKPLDRMVEIGRGD
jgi:quinolinate synthase